MRVKQGILYLTLVVSRAIRLTCILIICCIIDNVNINIHVT